MRAVIARLPDPVTYRVIAAQFRIQERELADIATIVPAGRTAVDVGAWWGPWTYWLSRRAPLVYAFEPQPELAAFLRRVTGPNVRVVEAALADTKGDAELVIPDAAVGQDALAHLGRTDDRHTQGATVRVDVRRLDDYDLGDVGFIKIDVEGHELAVLDGAAETLKRCRPALLVEIEARHSRVPIEETFRHLAALDYVGAFRLARRWHPLETFETGIHQARPGSRRYVNNFLFTPGPLPADLTR